jgi:hypothetical protein
MENSKKEEEIKQVNLAKNKKIDTPLIIALFAVLISFFSVLLGYKETSILEEQQKLLFQQQGASVWPFLENSPDIEIGDSTALFNYRVTNKGVGPAIVDNVIYTYKNREITSWGLGHELEKDYPNLSIQQTRNANLSTKVLAPGEVTNVITISFTTKGNFEDTLIDYCYCSVFGECWKVDGLDDLVKSSDCNLRSGLVN